MTDKIFIERLTNKEILVGNIYKERPIYKQYEIGGFARGLFERLCVLSSHKLRLCEHTCHHCIGESDYIFLADIIPLVSTSLLEEDTYCELVCIYDDILHVIRSDEQIYHISLKNIAKMMYKVDKILHIHKDN